MEIARESIFTSTLRSFCRMFFGVIGICFALFVFFFLYSLISSSNAIQDKTTMNYLPDANGKQEMVSLTAPVILQLNIHGVIGEPKTLDSDIVRNILSESRRGLLASNRVKGILIHMNSPGGTVVDSDNIYRMIKQYKERYKVPVFVYIEGLCASGGMYISCAADQIYAGPSSITGSVGTVIGPFFNVYEAMAKLGVSSETISQGLNKDMMSPFRPWKAGEDSSLKEITSFFYHRFVDIVVAARPRMDKERLIHEYGANVFDPVKAKEYGYIDFADSSRDETLVALLKEAKIDPDSVYQVVELEPKNALLSLFTSQSPLFTGKIEHSVDLGGPKIKDQFAYLYQPREN